MQNKHQNFINIYDQELKIEHRFIGGRSNYTYLTIKAQDKYVFRIPGEGGNNFVDYYQEEKNINVVKNLDINTEVIFLDPSCGVKISRFIEGNELDDNGDLNVVANTLKILHNNKILFENNYSHFERLTKYEKLHNNIHVDYFKLKEEFKVIYDKYLVSHIIFPCHNDAQAANFILSDTNKVYLLDWEFAGNNDYIYDIATFGNDDFSKAESLLEIYIDNPTDDDYIRLYAWRMFQCLQWFNVASCKAEMGLCENLEVDFDAVASDYINTTKVMYDKVIKYIK